MGQAIQQGFTVRIDTTQDMRLLGLVLAIAILDRVSDFLAGMVLLEVADLSGIEVLSGIADLLAETVMPAAVRISVTAIRVTAF